MKESSLPPPVRRAASPYDIRRESLQRRVSEVAATLYAQGIRPTVTRVRGVLGGGSPNDLTPALKQWRDVELPKLPTARISGASTTSPPNLPLQITDLAREFWQRALAAAVLEAKSGAPSRDVAARTAEAQLLREQVSSLRDQLQRESLAYGELQVQAARHEVMAREALSREQASAARERSLVREVGALRQRMAELGVLVERGRVTPPIRTAARKKGKPHKDPPSRPARAPRASRSQKAHITGRRRANKAVSSRRRRRK